jgi:hypothetical protein
VGPVDDEQSTGRIIAPHNSARASTCLFESLLPPISEHWRERQLFNAVFGTTAAATCVSAESGFRKSERKVDE